MIYIENCIDTMRRMESESIDLVVTSPPYDRLRNYQVSSDFSSQFDEIANELLRVLKVGGVLVWIVADQTINGSETGTSFRHALKFQEIGFNIHDTMIWTKHSIPKTHRRYEQEFEYMFILSKGKPKTFNPVMIKSKYFGANRTCVIRQTGAAKQLNSAASGMKRKTPAKETRIKGNIWHCAIGRHSSVDPEAFEHPAIFPEKLVADHIYSWSNEGDTVYDPFGGSGTTLKMAILAGRNGIMSETNPQYAQIAQNRIDKYTQQ